jgi:hypothetical protein
VIAFLEPKGFAVCHLIGMTAGFVKPSPRPCNLAQPKLRNVLFREWRRTAKALPQSARLHFDFSFYFEDSPTEVERNSVYSLEHSSNKGKDQ